MLKETWENASLFDVYENVLRDLICADERVIQLEADTGGFVREREAHRLYPDRCIDVGIMEANMVGVACGMSLNGMIPYLHTFGVFAVRRTLDQIFISGCYNRANVKIFGSKPGIMGLKDGGTHMAFEDIAVTQALPGMMVFDVADPVLFAWLLHALKDRYGMAYTRFARRGIPSYYAPGTEFAIGKSMLLRDGDDVTIIASGIEVVEALKAAELLAAAGVQARVVDMFTIKPLDREQILTSAAKTGCLVTAENHNVIGGLGSAVATVLCDDRPVPLVRVGVNDTFGQVGSYRYLQKNYGLDADAIVRACERAIRRKEEAV